MSVAGFGNSVVELDLLTQCIICQMTRNLASRLMSGLRFISAIHLANQVNVFSLNDIRGLPLRVLLLQTWHSMDIT
jgi:hypothetical protein